MNLYTRRVDDGHHRRFVNEKIVLRISRCGGELTRGQATGVVIVFGSQAMYPACPTSCTSHETKWIDTWYIFHAHFFYVSSKNCTMSPLSKLLNPRVLGSSTHTGTGNAKQSHGVTQ